MNARLLADTACIVYSMNEANDNIPAIKKQKGTGIEENKLEIIA